jgi:DNA-binding PadR family transcriptional regulator
MNSRATNGKIKKVYRLTPDGELAYADILKKFQPIVDRINNK